MSTYASKILPIAFASLCMASAKESPRAPLQPATITFINGDYLEGKLQAISTDVLTWDSPVLAEPANLIISEILDLNTPVHVSPTQTQPIAALTLKNDNVARGELVGINDTSITINTSYAGLMHFNRLMVKKIDIEGASHFNYQGPNSLDGWVTSGSPPTWTYNKQAFITEAPGGIARDHALPMQSRVSFDVEWKSDMLALKIFLFSSSPQSTNPNRSAEITIRQRSINYRSAVQRTYFRPAIAPQLAENEKAHIEILSSRISGRTVMLINDSVIADWSDPELKHKELGTAIHFVSYNSKPMRLSNIKIRSWDGFFESNQDAFFNDEDQPFQPKPLVRKPNAPKMMNLINGDFINGEIKNVSDGLITVASELGEIILPVERFSNLFLPGLGTSGIKLYKGDIRASFADGSHLVFRFDDIQDNKIIGYSQTFGTASFPLTSIQRIEFNLYPKHGSRPSSPNPW